MTVFNAVSGGGSQASVPMDERVKAWVIFDATQGTLLPLNSYNVASITDNGVGKFAINFTNDMPSENYAPVGWAAANAALGSVKTPIISKLGSTADPTVSAFSFNATIGGGTYVDPDYVSIAIFGG